MPDISVDKASPISTQQAGDLAREMSQIFWAPKDRIRKPIKGAFKVAGWAIQPLKERVSKPGHRHGIKSNRTDKLAMGAKGGATRNPKVMGTKFHEINTEMGKKNSKGQWVYKGANFTIKSKSSNDITVTRKGETEPVLKIKQGRVKTNNLTKPEIAKTHKAHSKTMSQGMGR